MGQNGSIYLLAENSDASGNAGAQMILNGLIGGNSANASLSARKITLNGNIDVSGDSGGSVTINAKSIDQNGNIKAIGNNGQGGNVDIWSTRYVSVKNIEIDVSGKTQGGNINVEGDYQFLSSGTYKATSSDGLGGTIKISSPLTKLFAVDVDASGYTGGGNIFLGGAGTSGESVQSGLFTIFSDASVAKANCTGPTGNGGKVYIDSDNTAYVFGNIQAKGNGSAGSGGYVEISGKQYLSSNATVDTGGGTLFIDPKNIIISDSEIGGISYNSLLQDGSTLLTTSTLSLTTADQFGSSVALYNNLLAIGAMGDSTGGSARGAAYLFSFNSGSIYSGLTLNTKLANGSLVNGSTLSFTNAENFGSSVALYNNLLTIGAMGDATGGGGRGAAYLLNFDSGTNYTNLNLFMKLASGSTLPGGGTLTLLNNGNFGSSASIYNNLLAIGAKNDNTGGSARGAAYLFSFTAGTPYTSLILNTKLANGSPLPGGGGSLTLADNALFGSGLALYNTLLTVGSQGDTTGGASTGAAYLFNFDNTIPYNNLGLTAKIANGTVLSGGGTLNLASGGNFGSAVSLYNNLLAIGSQLDSTGGAGKGAAYLFSFTPGTNYSNLVQNTKLVSGSTMINAGGGTYTLTLANNDNFGSGLALYNNLLTIGASHSSVAGACSAYLLSFDSGTNYNNLTFNTKLANGSNLLGPQIFTLTNNDNFGSSIALTDRLLAIGAFNDDTGGTNRGATYLFSFDSGSKYANLSLISKLASGTVLSGGGTLTIPLSANFGSAVALTDRLLAVGASGESTSSGAAYLFTFNSGTNYTNLVLNKKIVNGTTILGPYTFNLAANGYFGSSIALTDRLLAIGAYRDSTVVNQAGAAYLLSFDAGTNYANLTYRNKLVSGVLGLSLGSYDNFGSSIALTNQLLAVGASGNTTYNGGATYLFNFDSNTPYTNLVQNQILRSGVFGIVLQYGDRFGSGVALTNKLLTVGSQGEGFGTNTGAAYLFSFNANTPYTGLTLNRTLINGSALAKGTILSLLDQGFFGSSVALTNYLLAVGALGDPTGGTGRGAAYLMSFDADTAYANLQLDNKFASGSPVSGRTTITLANNDFFGSSVAIYNNLISIGAPGTAGGGTSRGATYLGYFNAGTNFNNLAFVSKISNGSVIGGTTITLANGDNFGSSVALSNNLLTIGASGDDTGGPNRGAVYLFNFDTGSQFNNLVVNQKLASGSPLPGGGGPLSLLDNGNFGSSAALTNSLMTIGAMNDTNNGAGTGAAYLFTFTAGTAYANLGQFTKLVNGSTLPGGGGPLTLSAGDNFGSSVSLINNLLAIGAQGDSSGRGAEYLFSFDTGTNYTNLALNRKLANGSVIGAYTLSLNTGDNFGCSAALNSNLLTIGAKNDDTGGTNRGAEYLFSYDTGTNYSNLTFDTKLANGSTIMNSVGGDYILNLANNDNFGSASSLYNNLFAVGASGNSGGTNKGGVYLFNIIDQSIGNYTFAAFPSATLYLSASKLGTWLNSQNVRLQANNDITVLGAVTGGGFNLIMQAGRSIDINANITTGNGALTLVANETVAAGVINSYRDAGAAEINMASGTTINAGTGNVSMTLKAGNDKTNFTSDSITLNNITAKTINVANQGLTAGSNVLINGAITASGVGSSSFSATGAITQSILGSGFSMTGPTSFTAASTQNISLTNPTNNFIGDVSVVSGNNVSIRDANALQMGTSTINGNLTLVTNGAITQSGALSITGATTLTAGATNDIILTNALNQFVGPISVISAKDVSITNNAATQMDTSTINNNFTLISNGAITQNGALSINGTTSLTAGATNDITLTNSANDFFGAVSIVSGKNVSLNDVNGIIMGNSTLSGNFSLTAGGPTHLNSMTAVNILILSGADVIIDAGAVLKATGTTNPLVLSSSSGNIINNSGAGALVTPAGRWLLYSGSPADTVLNGLTPVGSIFDATYSTVPPTSVPPGNYVLYRSEEPYSGGGGGGNASAAAASAAAIIPAALASTSYGGLTPLILYPIVYIRQDGFTGAAVPVIDTSRPTYRAYVDRKGKIKKIEMLTNQ